jgi:hypothetical protein
MAIDIQPAGASFTVPHRRGPVECVCPFPFAIVPGDQAEQAMADLAKAQPATAPVILGDPDSASRAIESCDFNDLAPEVICERASQLDADAWLAARPVEIWGDEDDIPPPPLAGSWPDNAKPSHTLNAIWMNRNMSAPGQRLPYPQIVIALCPTSDPADIAAHLKFGGFNDCPAPEVHVAFARRWAERYAAHSVVCTADVLEFRIGRPVATRKDAMRLAMEQYTYCPDIVDQGTETIERLAATLLGGTAWFFWWD